MTSSQTLTIQGMDNRPFGILCNEAPIGFRMGSEYFPTVEHFMMASLLSRPQDRALVLSYSSLYDARHVFNRLDADQYMKILREGTDAFHMKKAQCMTKTATTRSVGARFRDAIRVHPSYEYHMDQENQAFMALLGLYPVEMDWWGYNVVGLSLERVRQELDWRGYRPSDEEEWVKNLVHGGDVRSDKEPDERESTLYQLHHELKYNPKYKIREFRNLILGEIEAVESGIKARAALSRKKVPPAIRATPEKIFKILQAVEFMIETIQNGESIQDMFGQPVELILVQHKVAPAIFGYDQIPMPAEQRSRLYWSTWEQFQAKTLPHYSLVCHELHHPGNLAGFVRREYAPFVNQFIGHKISDLLLRGFFEHVIRSYPDVELTEELIPILLQQEAARFPEQEKKDVVFRLYHLYHNQKVDSALFPNDSEPGAGLAQKMLTIQPYRPIINRLESNRMTVEQIQEAVAFVPKIWFHSDQDHIVSSSDTDDILNPEMTVDLLLDGLHFHQLTQYLFYLLFRHYGGASRIEAYDQLRIDPTDKSSPLYSSALSQTLQMRLQYLIQQRRQKLAETALTMKWEQHRPVQEMLTWIEAKNKILQMMPMADSNTAASWHHVTLTMLDDKDRSLAEILVQSFFPEDYEKFAYGFYFVQDFLRSLRLFRELIATPIHHDQFLLFLECFYPDTLFLLWNEKEEEEEHHPVPEAWKAITRAYPAATQTDMWDCISVFLTTMVRSDRPPSQLAMIKSSLSEEATPLLAARVITRILFLLFDPKQGDHVSLHGDYYEKQFKMNQKAAAEILFRSLGLDKKMKKTELENERARATDREGVLNERQFRERLDTIMEENLKVERSKAANAADREWKAVREKREIMNEHLYLLTRILTGNDNVSRWVDPVFRFDMTTEKSNMPMAFKTIPKTTMDITGHDASNPLFELFSRKMDKSKNLVHAVQNIAIFHPILRPHLKTLQNQPMYRKLDEEKQKYEKERTDTEEEIMVARQELKDLLPVSIRNSLVGKPSSEPIEDLEVIKNIGMTDRELFAKGKELYKMRDRLEKMSKEISKVQRTMDRILSRTSYATDRVLRYLLHPPRLLFFDKNKEVVLEGGGVEETKSK